MDYVLLAWVIVKGTPVWDNPPHNKPRILCFKTLSAFCMAALKNGSWADTVLKDLRDRYVSPVE